MLTETTTDDILKGYELCQKLSRSTGIPIVFGTCAKHLEDELKAQTKDDPGLQNFPHDVADAAVLARCSGWMKGDLLWTF